MSAAVRKAPPLNVRGVGFVVLGLAGLWVGVQGGEYRFFGPVFAMFGFFFAATFLGRAGRIAVALKPLVGRTVRVEVWGAPLPGPDGALYDVNTIIALGSGLILHLLPESGEAGAILRVSQPRDESLADERIEIAAAASVRWAGRRLERPAGTAAPAVVLGMP
jgi:hypothetical protein